MCNLDHGDSVDGLVARESTFGLNVQFSESDALPFAVTCGADSQVGSRRSRSMTSSPLPELMHVDVEQTCCLREASCGFDRGCHGIGAHCPQAEITVCTKRELQDLKNLREDWMRNHLPMDILPIQICSVRTSHFTKQANNNLDTQLPRSNPSGDSSDLEIRFSSTISLTSPRRDF